MKSLILICCLSILCKISLAQDPKIITTNPISPVGGYVGEFVSQVKLAKEYFMTSPDSAAGRTYEERVANLAKNIKEKFRKFGEKRTLEYRKVGFSISSFDWATGHHAPKTISLPPNTYTFTKIERTTNGDWKGGPIINGVNREDWFNGDIEGGPVKWVTGGHGKAKTNWTITAKYSEPYIASQIVNEFNTIRQALNAQSLPSDL